MYDLLIVGGGVSALSLLHDLPPDMNVLVLQNSKTASSELAQGGIATSLFEPSMMQHITDTYVAGCRQGDLAVIEALIATGNGVLRDYIDEGIPFDRQNNRFELALEAAHSLPRILHMKDRTGYHLCQWLRQHIKAHVTHVTGDLLELTADDDGITGAVYQTASGTYRLDCRQIVLATGGASGLYGVSSNASERSAIPLMLAEKVGCTLKNMAYFQFHPTLLDAGQRNQLISEAVRGAGGVLVTNSGERVMAGGDLAPRDVVARAIYNLGEQAYLDISAVQDFSDRFPAIRQVLDDHHIDDAIPVTPGAHYMIGGIATDTSGRTDVSGLYVIGEASCTGFHGANRLASNSLLEGLAMGRLCAAQLKQSARAVPVQLTVSTVTIPSFRFKDELMTYCGIHRTEHELKKGLAFFSRETTGIDRLYHELCCIIIRSALSAPSAGVHYITNKKER